MAGGSYLGMVALSCIVNNTNKFIKSTSKTGLIAEIVQVITHEVIENEIVDLNVLSLNLGNIFQVSFYNLWLPMHPEISMLSALFIVSPKTTKKISHFTSSAMDLLQEFD